MLQAFEQGDELHAAVAALNMGEDLARVQIDIRWFPAARRRLYAGRQGKVLLDFGKRPYRTIPPFFEASPSGLRFFL